MTAVEYIKNYTKGCSNAIVGHNQGESDELYAPWLSPDNALAAVEIAKEEFIEKAREFFEENLTEEECKFGCSEWIETKTKYESIDSFIRAFERYIKGK